MNEDPIVDEIRKYRQENAAKFGYNVRAIAEDARKREKSGRRRVVSSPGKTGRRLRESEPPRRAAAKKR